MFLVLITGIVLGALAMLLPAVLHLLDLPMPTPGSAVQSQQYQRVRSLPQPHLPS